MAKDSSIAEYIIGAPVVIDCEANLAVAEKLMEVHKIRHLPVIDGRRIFGIISDRDLKLAKAVNKNRAASSQTMVKDICINEPYVVDESEPLHKVAAVMARRRIGSVIVTRRGDISGIFTTTDACRLLAEITKR